MFNQYRVPNNREMRELFNQVYRGKNFLTPEFYGLYYSLKNPSLISEVSSGTGIAPGSHVVAVTVILAKEDGTVVLANDLRETFHGDNKWGLLSEAREYAESLEI